MARRPDAVMPETVAPQADESWEQLKRRDWGGFGGAGDYESLLGGHAREVDREAVASLLSEATPGRRVLDLPCGAGRMSHWLLSRSSQSESPEHRSPEQLISADYSPGMLAVAQRRLANPVLRCDAFELPFGADSFDSFLCLRLIFHYQDPAPILTEAARVLRPGGELVFDTLNAFSTRHLVEQVLRVLGLRRKTTGLRFMRRREVAALAAACGLQVTRDEARYLLPTRLYRVLPRILCRLLQACERWVPSPLRVLTFWRVVKPS